MFYKLSNKIVKDNVVSTDLSILIYSRHIAPDFPNVDNTLSF